MPSLPPIDFGFTGGTTFLHPQLPPLTLRFAPTEVDWKYNLNTAETNTYAGQVIQVLSVNFESFTIQGRFGTDSRDDYVLLQNGTWQRKAEPSTLAGKYGPGLTQMTEWFRQYFSIASQGLTRKIGSTDHFDNYNQSPVTVFYQGNYDDILVDDNKVETSWKVYPVSFPSYKISNDNFAPEWRVECQVYEAPQVITGNIMQEAIARLAYQPLYQPGSKFSDPNPVQQPATAAQLRAAAQAAFDSSIAAADLFMTNLPTYTVEDVQQMILQGFSSPVNLDVQQGVETKKHTEDPFQTGILAPDASEQVFAPPPWGP